MTCLAQPGCQKSQYQPDITNVTSVLDPTTPARDKDRCSAPAEKAEAEAKAKADLIAACAALNETITCPGDCDCQGEGALPAAWTTISGVLAWIKTEPTAAGCKYKVTIHYKLQYRETTPGKCYKKPPHSPE